MLQEVVIEGRSLNSWLNAAQGIIGTFGLGNETVINGARWRYTGPGDWARQVAGVRSYQTC